MTCPDGDLFSEAEWDSLCESLSLSGRQEEIVSLILEGLTDRQIAQRTGIAVPTVRTHLARVFQKLGVQDRLELVLHLFRLHRAGCEDANCPRRERQRD